MTLGAAHERPTNSPRLRRGQERYGTRQTAYCPNSGFVLEGLLEDRGPHTLRRDRLFSRLVSPDLCASFGVLCPLNKGFLVKGDLKILRTVDI